LDVIAGWPVSKNSKVYALRGFFWDPVEYFYAPGVHFY